MQNYTAITKQGKAEKRQLICQSVSDKQWWLILRDKRGQFHQNITNTSIKIQIRNKYIIIVVVARKEGANTQMCQGEVGAHVFLLSQKYKSLKY
jgi:hypothetical protein